MQNQNKIPTKHLKRNIPNYTKRLNSPNTPNYMKETKSSESRIKDTEEQVDRLKNTKNLPPMRFGKYVIQNQNTSSKTDYLYSIGIESKKKMDEKRAKSNMKWKEDFCNHDIKRVLEKLKVERKEYIAERVKEAKKLNESIKEIRKKESSSYCK